MSFAEYVDVAEAEDRFLLWLETAGHFWVPHDLAGGTAARQATKSGAGFRRSATRRPPARRCPCTWGHAAARHPPGRVRGARREYGRNTPSKTQRALAQPGRYVHGFLRAAGCRAALRSARHPSTASGAAPAGPRRCASLRAAFTPARSLAACCCAAVPPTGSGEGDIRECLLPRLDPKTIRMET